MPDANSYYVRTTTTHMSTFQPRGLTEAVRREDGYLSAFPEWMWLHTFCSRSGGRRDRYPGMKLSVKSLGGSEQRRAMPCSRSILSPQQRQH
jgi:hypothetical protein